jgi:hypothetical protein
MLTRGVVAVASIIAAVAILSVTITRPAFATGDVNETTCPVATETSPGFRAYLPDCRSYEMVTPPYKDGGANVKVQAISGDGSRMIINSFGVFAGAEGDPIDALAGAMYQLARSGSGWVTSSVTPPASLSPGSHFLGASADATKVLWEVLGSSKSAYDTDLDVRETNGTFVPMGPLTPPAGAAGPPAGNIGGENEEVGFAGASRDLSHVLFTIRAANPALLWPGDTTNPGTEKSLYEYVGTGNAQPMLVGICTTSMGGSCPNGEGRLISNCGTVLGSAEVARGGDTYNAVSANGEAVLFTALGHNVNGCKGIMAPEVSELYARLDQLQTVPVSEPSPNQCEQCNTTVRMPAVFQGASEDGSKAFFLTEQELFKGNTTMNLYEYDFDNPTGQKIVQVSSGSPTPEVQGVARISEDGSHVYFVAKGVLTGMNAEGKSPVHGANNLYVFERDEVYPNGRTTFVATLSSETEAELKTDEEPCAALSGEEKEVCEKPFIREFDSRNEADSGKWNPFDSRQIQATPTGRFLVFTSVADLTAGDTSAARQVFEYDAMREKLVRVSIGAAGYAPGNLNASTNESYISSQSYTDVSVPTEAATRLAVSADGSNVLFSSLGALTKGAEGAAAAGAYSVYEYHSVGAIENGNVYLISDGTNMLSTEIAGLDASGDDAFFSTADSLVPSDVDTQFDIYDARVGGGFSAPVAPATCEGDACQGTSSAPPTFETPGSVSEVGGGNLATQAEPKPRPKPRAKHKRKAKAKERRKRGTRSKVHAKGDR